MKKLQKSCYLGENTVNWECIINLIEKQQIVNGKEINKRAKNERTIRNAESKL